MHRHTNTQITILHTPTKGKVIKKVIQVQNRPSNIFWHTL